MIDPRISQEPFSSTSNSAEEKSKQRTDELKASASSKAAFTNRKNLSKEAQEAAIVDELNRTFAIVHTSSTYVLIEKSETDFVLDSKTSFLNLFENQLVPDLSNPNSKKAMTKAQVWLKSQDRRTFYNIVFNPRIAGHYEGNFNIWKGFAVKPITGDCSLFWEHVRVIICDGKEASYIYVRKWLAHLIQKPWVIATALVLRGKQGTGKGTFVDAIGKLLGSHYAPLANLDQIFDMKLESASSIDRFIYASLKEGSWDHNDNELPREYPSDLVIDAFYRLYKDWCVREHQILSSSSNQRRTTK